MGKTSSFWVRMRAAFAALVLAVVALGPSLDQAICSNEWMMGAVAAETSADISQVSASSPHDHQTSGHVGEAGGVCAHGHCHHSAPFVPSTAVADSGLVAVASPHALPLSSPSIDDLTFGLKRPPRV